ncbi:MAG TPA: restriction endonuclease subunit S [Bacilli bacterium]|nr:restriction endonuclease subunit S [Bacilli bacterium]
MVSDYIDKFVIFGNGKSIKKIDKGKYPIYGANGIIGWSEDYNYSNVIAIGRVGSTGTVTKISGKCWLSDNTISVKNRDNSHFDYIYYLLKSKDLNRLSIGSTQPLITQGILKNIKHDFHNLHEQKAIANILSSLDDKIETNIKINKNLEELAQTLYRRWFVDFEFPNENGEPYRSSGGEMVESDFGPIPKEWRLSNLLEIADYMNGIAVKKYAADEGEISIPVLKIKELGVGNVTVDSDRCNLSVPEKYIIKKGDLIFSWSGTLLVDFWTGSKSVLNQHLFKVSSKKYPRWFYYYWTKYHLEKFQNIAKSMATTMGHIKREDLSKSLVVIPVNNHLEQGSIILESIIDEILKLRIQNNKLSKLRDELLPKLMNGEIEVPIEE